MVDAPHDNVEPLRFTFDGLTLAADGRGPRDGQTVLLLHGGGQTRHAWGGTAAALADRGYRAIALDARGHGDSSWDDRGRYQLEHFATDLQQIIETLAATPIIVGASLGGTAALLAVGELGATATAIVLVDIAPRVEPAGVARIMGFMTARPDGFASLEEAADAVAGYLPHRTRPEDLSGLRKNLRVGQDGRYRWHWDPAFAEAMGKGSPDQRIARIEAAARAVAVPTLLIRGKMSDLLSDRGVRHFLELVPHAQYVDVSGAAHMVAGDRNDRFSAAVLTFLASLEE